jgi:hypothetical protein
VVFDLPKIDDTTLIATVAPGACGPRDVSRFAG